MDVLTLVLVHLAILALVGLGVIIASVPEYWKALLIELRRHIQSRRAKSSESAQQFSLSLRRRKQERLPTIAIRRDTAF
jgi:hypothetical protein